MKPLDKSEVIVPQSKWKRFAARHRGALHAGLAAALLLGGAGAVYQHFHTHVTVNTFTSPPLTQAPKVVKEPMQIALLLDTSSSMSGLIDQARSQLWRMINDLGSGRRVTNGVTHEIDLEIAVYEYGHSRLSPESGFIRQVVPFSRDLDAVSEALYSLSTNGGDEYAGQAIATAVSELAWSKDSNVLKFAFIAGNESFGQGPVAPEVAIASAAAKGISVQVIHCGGSDASWADAAQLAQTDVINIDHNAVAAYVAAPQDAEIAALSQELNTTYLGYGAHAAAAAARQASQDRAAASSGFSSVVGRAKAKASSKYANTHWDLVDGVQAAKVDLGKMRPEGLPAELQGKSVEEMKAIVGAKAQRRAEIQRKIQELSAARDLAVAKEEGEADAQAQPRLDSALIKSAKDKAAKKGYTF